MTGCRQRINERRYPTDAVGIGGGALALCESRLCPGYRRVSEVDESRDQGNREQQAEQSHYKDKRSAASFIVRVSRLHTNHYLPGESCWIIAGKRRIRCMKMSGVVYTAQDRDGRLYDKLRQR